MIQLNFCNLLESIVFLKITFLQLVDITLNVWAFANKTAVAFLSVALKGVMRDTSVRILAYGFPNKKNRKIIWFYYCLSLSKNMLRKGCFLQSH